MKTASAPRHNSARASAADKTVFRVVTPIKREGEEKTFWQRIGMAFENVDDSGATKSISVRLNALPVNGEIVLFPDDGNRGSDDGSRGPDDRDREAGF